MTWEVFSYGGGDFLRLIFTAIAQIFGDNDYYVALRVSALVGSIGFLVALAFQQQRMNVNWLLALVMVLLLAVVPKVTVTITDRVVPANSSVVSNIPIGLGATASLFSKVGDWMTRTFETVFSLPNELQYKGNGLLFASYLVEESTRFEVTDPALMASLIDFWKSCVYYDLLLNLYSWDQLIKSPDLLEFFQSNTSRTRSFTYQNSGGAKSIIMCRDGINAELADDLDAEINNSLNIQGVRLVSDAESRSAAVSRFAAALPVAYQYLTGLSLNNANIISQNVLANSLKRGLSNFASDADAAAAAEDFAVARAEQERRTTFHTMGKLAKRMLPMMKDLFESFLYAVFPIVIMLAMLPVAGRVALGYVKALFWINLWAPLYAILHFAMTYYGQHAASNAVVQAGGGFPTGLSIMTNTGLGHVLGDYAAIAGYLSLSIPMIAWMMVSQSGAMLSSLAGRMMQSYDQPVAKAADEATAGNISLGNTRYETSSAFQANSAPSFARGGISAGDGVGNATRLSGDGRVFNDIASSTAPLGIQYGSMATSSARETYSQAVSHEQAAATQMGESNAALFNQLHSVSERIQQTSQGAETLTGAQRDAYSKAQENTQRIMNEYAAQHGLTANQVTSASAGLHLGGTGAVAGGSVSDSDAYNSVKGLMESEQFGAALRAEASVLQDSTVSRQLGLQDSSDMGLSSAYNRSVQASQSHSSAVREVEQASQQLDYAKQVSASIQAKGDDAFLGWLSSEKGIGNFEARQLIADANGGNLAAMQHRDAYAREYVNSALSSYSQNQSGISGSLGGISSSDIGAQFIVSSGQVAAANDGFQQQLGSGLSRADAVASLESRSAGISSRLSAANYELDATGLDGRDIASAGDAIKANVLNEQERGAVDRSADLVQGKVKSVGEWFETVKERW